MRSVLRFLVEAGFIPARFDLIGKKEFVKRETPNVIWGASLLNVVDHEICCHKELPMSLRAQRSNPCHRSSISRVLTTRCKQRLLRRGKAAPRNDNTVGSSIGQAG